MKPPPSSINSYALLILILGGIANLHGSDPIQLTLLHREQLTKDTAETWGGRNVRGPILRTWKAFWYTSQRIVFLQAQTRSGEDPSCGLPCNGRMSKPFDTVASQRNGVKVL